MRASPEQTRILSRFCTRLSWSQLISADRIRESSPVQGPKAPAATSCAGRRGVVDRATPAWSRCADRQRLLCRRRRPRSRRAGLPSRPRWIQTLSASILPPVPHQRPAPSGRHRRQAAEPSRQLERTVLEERDDHVDPDPRDDPQVGGTSPATSSPATSWDSARPHRAGCRRGGSNNATRRSSRAPGSGRVRPCQPVSVIATRLADKAPARCRCLDRYQERSRNGCSQSNLVRAPGDEIGDEERQPDLERDEQRERGEQDRSGLPDRQLARVRTRRDQPPPAKREQRLPNLHPTDVSRRRGPNASPRNIETYL